MTQIKRNRRSIRLPGYDYSQPGGYFITIVTYEREMLFGEVVNGEMILNNLGNIVTRHWNWLALQYPYVGLDEFVIMPNHLHGIILINAVDTIQKTKPLGRLIGAFKTVSTKEINLLNDSPGAPLWQRNYYERIIRNEGALDRIRTYIRANPRCWADDRENPARW